MSRLPEDQNNDAGGPMDGAAGPITGPDTDAALIDVQVLDSLLSLPDESLQASLSTQIIADLKRLEQALAVAQPGGVARLAHELKGLTATIGAMPLADLAVRLQLADELGQDSEALNTQLLGQIVAVCDIIARRAR